MKREAEDLRKLEESIANKQYKRSVAIIGEIGKGLAEQARRNRYSEINHHLKASGQDWFLPIVYTKYAVQRDNMVAAVLILQLLLRPRYRQKQATINEALALVLGWRNIKKMARFTQEVEFDWKLLNWLD